MKAAESIRLLERVAELYAHRLHESPAAAECLRQLEISDPAVLEQFHGGYSDGTVLGLIPGSGELREALRAKGIITEAGQEALQGCLVVPVFGEDGGIVGFCGVKPTKESGPVEIVVPAKVPGLVRGAVARDGLPLFVTDRVLDGFALWLSGFKNVTICPNINAALPQLESIGNEDNVGRICLCFGRGTTAPVSVEGFRAPVAQVEWPEGTEGARDFFQKHTAKDFEALLPSWPVLLRGGVERKDCSIIRRA
jgi:hypothetical protein